MSHEQEDLAYGDDYSRDRASSSQEGERGLIGDAYRFLKGRYQQSSQPQQPYTQSGPGGQSYNTNQPSGQPQYGSWGPVQSSSQQQYGQAGYSPNPQQESQPPYSSSSYQGQPPHSSGPYPSQPPSSSASYQGQPPYSSNSYQGQQQKPDLAAKLFGTLHETIQNIGSDIAGKFGGNYEPQPYGSYGSQGAQSGYVAQAGSQNRFGSFVSPKPGNDVKWYVDGCSYFWAVSQALEGARESIWILDWWLSPEVYMRRPPAKNEQWRLDRVLQRAAQRGVRVNIIVYKEVTQALTLSSSHTKHALEGLHPNIAVFRHPDHLPDAQTVQSSLNSSFQNLSLNAATVSQMGKDALKNLYGMSDDVILYWAHHEKLCLVDGKIAFMGGLDLCFGRWDTNQHPIADVHPSDINGTIFPGQDYNNARIMDFSDVAHPDQNKLDRRQFSRMGWSDISVSLQGPCVQDLRRHFVDRWNFIYNEKYDVRKDVRYSRLSMTGPTGGQQALGSHSSQQNTTQSAPYQPQPSPYGSNQSQSLQPPAAYPGPRPQSSGGNSPQFLPPPGSRPQSSSGANPSQFPPPPGSRPQSSSGVNPPQFAPPPGRTPSPQPSWQSGNSSLPYQQGYQQQQQQNPYNLPVPSYQPSGPTQPHSSQQAYSPQSQQAYTPSASGGQYYPPPPPGGPPHVSSPPSSQYSQQDNRYGYDSSANAQHGQAITELEASTPGQGTSYGGRPPSSQFVPPSEQSRGFDNSDEADDGPEGERGFGSATARYRDEGRRLGSELTGVANLITGNVQGRVRQAHGKFSGGTDQYGRPLAQPRGAMTCQIVRSCTKWSNGTPTEHSVQTAYIEAIENSQHFVYIENQFFITATGDSQHPVKNQIGKALVERILRAARAGDKYKVIVVIPSVPGFAGDLRDDSALGTRAIMEYQYNSINRGGHSIMELVGQAGYNPMDYIRFYNLRNYDRLNVSTMLQQAERQSGVVYEDARKQHDDALGGAPGTTAYGVGQQQFQQYQQAAHQVASTKPYGIGSGRWDSVSECYMLGGEDIRNVPWESPGELSEIDAFVSEELYIHSKVLIADDRVVICGSANLNDRSQLGTHDSEIAIVVEDPTPVQSTMAGRPWQASRFAASLRRQLFRKHLGLLRPQDMQRPDANFEPVGVPNNYDWGSPEDNVVADPLSDTFQSLWNSRARQNTDVFRQVFRAVPDDNVRNWNAYKEFYEYFFQNADLEAEGKGGKNAPPRYLWGHIVRDDFRPGPDGVRDVKDLLSRVRGTLVEMPLMFLSEEDIAKEGISLNALTEEIYT